MVYHPPMSREDPQMKIRLPADLKEEIEAAAKQSGRSMNAEIVARLEASFAPAQAKADADQLDILEVRDAQLSIVLTGLNLTEMAIQFVASEVPAVKKSTSFPKLKESIAAVRAVVVHGAANFDDSIAAADRSLSGLKAVTNDLRNLRTAIAPSDH